MYLRHSKVTKNGKTHTYWRLVKSVRVGSKVRQVTVAQLGELDSQGRAKASALAKHFLGPRAQQPELFEDTNRIGPLKVNGDKVRVEHGRAFGDVWLAYKLWQTLRERSGRYWWCPSGLCCAGRRSECPDADRWYRKAVRSLSLPV